MDKNSIVLITDDKLQKFGTGFVVDCDKNGSFIATCSHVVDEIENILINKTHKAKIISKGKDIDLAVLYIENLFLEPFEVSLVCQSDNLNIIGYSKFKNDFMQEEINASINKSNNHIHDTNGNPINIIKLSIDNQDSIYEGYSGSPVLCDNRVVGVISSRKGEKISYAIAINELDKVWNREFNISILLKDKKDFFTKNVSNLKDDISYEPIFDQILLNKSSKLFKELQKIRYFVTPYLKSIPNSLYSYNADAHAREVLRLVSILYYSALEKHLNEEELFILGTLCLIHDIGMKPNNDEDDNYILYQNHCQYSHDFAKELIKISLLNDKIGNQIALLCLVHNKPINRARFYLNFHETDKIRLNLIYSMFKIADMLEIEQQPGVILRMGPDIITKNIGEFDIDSNNQIIKLSPTVDAEKKYYNTWCNVLTDRFIEAEVELFKLDINYKVICKEIIK